MCLMITCMVIERDGARLFCLVGAVCVGIVCVHAKELVVSTQILGMRGRGVLLCLTNVFVCESLTTCVACLCRVRGMSEGKRNSVESEEEEVDDIVSSTKVDKPKAEKPPPPPHSPPRSYVLKRPHKVSGDGSLLGMKLDLFVL